MRFSAAFLDRDGTIIRDAGFVRHPSDLELLPGAAPAIERLNAHAIPVILITNQSGIGRGLISEADFHRVQAELGRQLAMLGCAVDATFYCPHAPDRVPPCGCRKPELGMYKQAAEHLHIELSRALYIGDRLSDVLPAVAFGARSFLIRPEMPQACRSEVPVRDLPEGCTVAPDLWSAIDLVLGPGEWRLDE